MTEDRVDCFDPEEEKLSDLDRAKLESEGHSCALTKGNMTLICDDRGVKPIVKLLNMGIDLSGFSAADKIVGKAAAFLFVKAKVAAVYAGVLSKGGKAVLEEHGIDCSYSTLTDKIINRAGTDVCPMEKAVEGLKDAEAAWNAILRTLAELGKKQ